VWRKEARGDETNSNSVRDLLDQRSGGSESWGGDVLTAEVPQDGLEDAKEGKQIKETEPVSFRERGKG